MQQPGMPTPGRQVPVFREFKTKHFVFSMANDGSTEPKKIGEWLTDQSLAGYRLDHMESTFADGKLHVFSC